MRLGKPKKISFLYDIIIVGDTTNHRSYINMESPFDFLAAF